MNYLIRAVVLMQGKGQGQVYRLKILRAIVE